MTDTPDYSDYKEDLGGNILAAITAKANEQAAQEAKVAQLEEDLSAAKERLREINERELPDLMDAGQQEDCKTSTGIRVRLLTKVRASIPKKNHAKALAWLRSHGHGDMIKVQVVAEFGKNDVDLAQSFEERLESTVSSIAAEMGRANDFTVNHKAKQEVHTSTLSSWAAKSLEDGDEIPMELLGVFRQRFTKIEVAE